MKRSSMVSTSSTSYKGVLSATLQPNRLNKPTEWFRDRRLICLADGNGTAELELEPGRPRAVAHTDGGGELNAGNVRKGSASLRLL